MSVAKKTRTKTDTTVVDKLWRDYKASGSIVLRDKLILHYSPLVKYVASRIFAGLPQNVENADLISYGIFGLMDAIQKYDNTRAIKFETYAIARIKGAIIDALRSLDWVPRSLRAKSKELEKSYARLEADLQRAPTDAEVAQDLGITIEDLQKWLSQLSYSSVVALDELWSVHGEAGDKISLFETIKDTKSQDPVLVVEFDEMKTILAGAIDNLPPKEKIVIALYYYEGLTLREIGNVLSITESRVSQLHTKAILRLKAKLATLRGE